MDQHLRTVEAIRTVLSNPQMFSVQNGWRQFNAISGKPYSPYCEKTLIEAHEVFYLRGSGRLSDAAFVLALAALVCDEPE